MPLAEQLRCTARIKADRGSPFRCNKAAVADGYCTTHHPLVKTESAAARQQAIYNARMIHSGFHDFWCQVAICALMMYLQKAASEYADALTRKLV